MLENYRRHKEFNPSIAERVVDQAREKGIGYVLSTVSDEARELYLGSRAVASECHRAKGFLRFSVCGGLLVAKAEFEHNTIDIVLKHFMLRFPRGKVVIISDGKAHVGEGGRVREESPKGYITSLKRPKTGDEAEWGRFYNSQYIEARRNRRLAMRAVPKKFWKRFGIKEGAKIDKGMPSVTLGDFME